MEERRHAGLTEIDIERIVQAVAEVVQKTAPSPVHPEHLCKFTGDEIEVMRDFCRLFADSKTRVALVSATEMWMDGTSTARKWVVRLFLIGVGALVAIGVIKAGASSIPK